MKPTLLLVDGSSYLYRAYHAMAHLSAPDGTRTNAIYGVLNMLRRLSHDITYDYCACIFDAKGKNFRHDMYPEYKANRPPMPDDLRPQADKLPQLVQQMGWHVLKIAGVEADDVIGTLSVMAVQQNMQVIISTGDKDMAQLVNEHVHLVDTMKNQTLDIDGVFEKFGVYPRQITDYLALVGDKVDNVPGVKNCGEKRAAQWLAQYGSLANIMQNANTFTGKNGEYLRDALTQLPLSHALVTIKTDVDLSTDLPHGIATLNRQEPDWAALLPQFQQLGFKTWSKEAEKHLTPNDLFYPPISQETLLPNPKPALAPINKHYQTINTEALLQTLLTRLSTAQCIALDTETTSLDMMQAHLVGISIAFGAGEAVYIPLAHTSTTQQLPIAHVLNALKPYLENPKLGKIGQNLKYDQHVFYNHGLILQGIVGDSMLASYIIESHLKHGLDDLAQRWLGLTTIKYEDLCGKGKKQISFAQVPIEQATEYACQDADFSWRIEEHLRHMMNDKQLAMYQQMELPLSQVLFEMENVGVKINCTELANQSHELGQQLHILQDQVYNLAGQTFNLSSPKQLQDILFNQMGLPTKGIKKTSTGGYSTDESVLEKLALDYPLPQLLLQHRSLAKLKSTYTDKLPEMINPKTQRVHTTYAQAVAITGRLASNHPNLQNIPIRTPEGRRVRRAFVADSNHIVLSADYSQIELRIMAHLSEDPTLIESFNNNEDVHRRTAAEVFGVSTEHISPEQRRYAKTINFGLIYGMSHYGLAKALGIDNTSAELFIQRYFDRYRGVAEYMQKMREQAQQQGYVETLFGRRLYLPDIHGKATQRASAERAAINAPMQGTASDLIKLAMLATRNFLQREHLQSKLIMQVHDELVLEVSQDECALIQQQLPQIMASVGKDVLAVPLIAEVGIGNNWDDAH